jgi:hypothetical protein
VPINSASEISSTSSLNPALKEILRSPPPNVRKRSRQMKVDESGCMVDDEMMERKKQKKADKDAEAKNRDDRKKTRLENQRKKQEEKASKPIRSRGRPRKET